MTAQLPIDELLPELVAALADRGSNAVIVAPPGSGKTTRVPPALVDAGLAGDGEVIVVQPRRLAARMAAARVAFERGESVGEQVGYEVRFDRKASARTRIRFVTEGVLTRKLLADPELRGVGAVIIDEAHERHLQGDVGLALARRLQHTTRPELRILAMSATIDPGPLAAFLGGAVFESSGSLHPVDVDYAPGVADWPLEKKVSAAVRTLVRDGLAGDVLVFLPGAAEIRRAITACAEIAAAGDLLVLPLHGELSPAEQDRAVARADRRKLIMATNVAETSITIDGVVAVIDSGLARIARHSPWTGVPALQVEPISRASATQRAGRAGRTRPGRCLRLYTAHDYDTRREQEVPEVRRADLAGALLELHAAQVLDIDSFGWFEPPPGAAVSAAEELLRRLGAIDAAGAITEVGRRLTRFPVHPRWARVMVEAEARGVAEPIAAVVAQAGQRPSRPSDRAATISGASDLLHEAEELRGPAKRARAQLLRIADTRRTPRPRDSLAVERELLISLLTGFPDRVARRRAPRSRELVLAGGSAALLSPASVVQDAELMIAVSAEERGRGASRSTVIRGASAIELDWLIDLYAERLRDVDELVWNRERQRVERVTKLVYDELTVTDERSFDASRMDPAAAATLLAEQAEAAGADRLFETGALDQFRHRLAFARAHGMDDLPDSGDELTHQLLRAMCTGLTSFAELKKQSITAAAANLLDYEQQRQLQLIAPEHISLPNRRRVPVHYEADRPPWIESRLQDFFGLDRGPTIARGAVPLVLHLLAPNRRAVQVTSDLAGFWQRHYPELRRQLMRRYPKHKWPEHGGQAPG